MQSGSVRVSVPAGDVATTSGVTPPSPIANSALSRPAIVGSAISGVDAPLSVSKVPVIESFGSMSTMTCMVGAHVALTSVITGSGSGTASGTAVIVTGTAVSTIGPVAGGGAGSSAASGSAATFGSGVIEVAGAFARDAAVVDGATESAVPGGVGVVVDGAGVDAAGSMAVALCR